MRRAFNSEIRAEKNNKIMKIMTMTITMINLIIIALLLKGNQLG